MDDLREAYCSDWWIIRHLVLCIDWIYLGRMLCSIVNHSDYFKGRGLSEYIIKSVNCKTQNKRNSN
jgi:hypothetical protein